MPSVSHSVLVGGRQVWRWQARYGSDHLVNCVRCPRGEHSGEAQFLMLQRDIAALPASGQVSVVLYSGSRSITFPRLFVHSAVRVHSGGVPTAGDAMSLVRLVDERWFLERYKSTTRAFNVRSYAGGGDSPERDYLDGTINAVGPAAYTLREIVALLWTDCGLAAIDFDALPAVSPEDLFFQGVNPWHALCDLCQAFGCVVIYNPLTDAYSIAAESPGSEPNAAAAGETLLFDANPYSGGYCNGPATFRVFFRKRYEDFGTEVDSGVTDNHILSDSYHSIDVAGLPEAKSGTVLPLWASTPAMVTASTASTILNSSALNDEAEALAAGWLANRAGGALTRAQIRVDGLVSTWVPGPQISVVLWDANQMVTEVSKFPGDPPQVVAALAAGSRSSGSAEPDENFQNADHARKSVPVWPRLQQIVRLDGSSGDFGKPVAALSGVVHPGKIRRQQAGGLTTFEDVWLQFTDDWDLLAGDVHALVGSYHMARLVGVYEEDDERRPLYQAVRGQVQWFGKPAADITAGSRGDVVVWYYNGSTWATSGFTIEDCLALASDCDEAKYCAIVWNRDWIIGPMEC